MMDMILLVFSAVGVAMSAEDAFRQLKLAYIAAGAACPAAKAAGSLGGAVHGGTIVFSQGTYQRVR